MKNKGRLLTLLGTLCLLSGILLLLAVLSTWLFPPAIPTDEDFRSGTEADPLWAASKDGPALAPYHPTSTALPHPGQSLPAALAEQNPTDQGSPSSQQPVQSAAWPQFPRDMGNHAPDQVPAGDLTTMRMIIPAIGVDAPVVSVKLQETVQDGRQGHQQWQVPDQYAAGWHSSSAPPGQVGNTVINGHNNIHGAIFHDLVDLPLGAEIIISDEQQRYTYQVSDRQFLLEQGQHLRDRLRNARWILPTNDERLTLVTCWPNSSNTHRLVVIATPVERS